MHIKNTQKEIHIENKPTFLYMNWQHYQYMVKCVYSDNVEMMKLGTAIMENHKMAFC